jgi:hypothetical protein
MESTVNFLLISLSTVGLVALTGLLYLALKLRSKNAGLVNELDLLRHDFNALCAGAVGVDKRVLRLEQRGRDLQQRQDNIEHRQKPTQRPYDAAIHLVQKGADAVNLVEEFGLTRSEADRIVMRHGMREAG